MLPLLTPGYATPDVIENFIDEFTLAKAPIIVDAAHHIARGESLVPPLSHWDPDWRYPDPVYWRGPSWWTMTPGLKGFYENVASHYRLIAEVGPLRWGIYNRND